jgi:hypothetical protein
VGFHFHCEGATRPHEQYVDLVAGRKPMLLVAYGVRLRQAYDDRVRRNVCLESLVMGTLAAMPACVGGLLSQVLKVLQCRLYARRCMTSDQCG